jgi:tetratricopeptide (TPR) repeat protein
MRVVPLLSVFAVVWAAAQAVAAPPPAKLKEAIARGRALVKKGDYTQAVKAFEEAVAVAPDDPTALSELGLAAFKANDLPRAEQASRKSVTAATSPNLRAASLYNLGRVQEARGEKAAAVESYARSLKDRPNKIVRERLLGLDAKAAAELDPITPRPLDGPFPSLAAYCKEPARREGCDEPAEEGGAAPKLVCDPRPVDGSPKTRSVVVFRVSCTEEAPDVTFTHLALGYQVDGKWWVLPDLEEMLESMRQTEVLERVSIETKDVVPGGAAELLVRTEVGFDYRGMSQRTTKHLRVVGVGPGKTPSATGAILVEQQSSESDEEGNDLGSDGAALDVGFLPDGQLEIKGPLRKVGRGLDKETLGGLLGKHPLVFP